jgi:hypothetical protein
MFIQLISHCEPSEASSYSDIRLCSVMSGERPASVIRIIPIELSDKWLILLKIGEITRIIAGSLACQRQKTEISPPKPGALGWCAYSLKRPPLAYPRPGCLRLLNR